MDGIDAAMIETDGERVFDFGPCATVPYEAGFRERLRAILGGVGAVSAVEEELTDLHAAAVERLFAVPRGIDLIGFHGHTILHQPDSRRTWQIGDGQRLAQRLGIPVVNDLRTADVAAGGQGAPLVPVYHAALAADLPKPLVVLNIGGVANVTWIGPAGDLLAFDTGPGNAPIDDWMRRVAGQERDEGGALAASGKPDAARVEVALGHAFFGRKPPKSLDRDDFTWALAEGLGSEDGAATLAAITVGAVARAAEHFPSPPRRWLLTGGGRHNATLMSLLRGALRVPVDPVEAVGWRGDALEAEAFAFLAVRHRLGLPNSFPGTTGVPSPVVGGRFWPVSASATS